MSDSAMVGIHSSHSVAGAKPDSVLSHTPPLPWSPKAKPC